MNDVTAPTPHVIIAGTGRTGTTFLVHLLTALGVDTGFSLADIPKEIDTQARAGLEWDPRNPDALYLIKNPYFFLYAKEILDNPNVNVDHIFIPIRDLEDAALSRITVSEAANEGKLSEPLPSVDGGVVNLNLAEAEVNILTAQLIDLLIEISRHNVPVTLIHFPTSIENPEYLYKKLLPLIERGHYAEFLRQFNLIAKPELVSKFNRTAPSEPVVNSISHLLHQNMRLNEEVNVLKKDFGKLLAGNSWKITKPLREIKRIAKRIARL